MPVNDRRQHDIQQQHQRRDHQEDRPVAQGPFPAPHMPPPFPNGKTDACMIYH